ncbi:hypothetical protein K443DRAFT_11315 [Laccaria amethystina LaAM-08-1]|uniref:Uncharacterized protein n=1 Tax=Laccaria amethystina LaAM-08-1 TaxID=1095629 RepID=A0A0C9WJZ4_9AGAR|nr:hypothetical protein K443DRAFT_11315 [Laccaria amethystina LaAM-08-1]
MTPNEYDRPQTATDDPLMTWDVYLNDSRTTITHHTKRARPPTNYTNHPQTTTAHYDKKRAQLPMKTRSAYPLHLQTKWPSMTRNEDNRPQTMATAHSQNP